MKIKNSRRSSKFPLNECFFHFQFSRKREKIDFRFEFELDIEFSVQDGVRIFFYEVRVKAVDCDSVSLRESNRCRKVGATRFFMVEKQIYRKKKDRT